MLATYSFECPACGHGEDRFVHRDARDQQSCPCGGLMKQVIRHAPKLDWLNMAQGDSAGPEFIDRFDKMHKDRKAHEERVERDHGIGECRLAGS